MISALVPRRGNPKLLGHMGHQEVIWKVRTLGVKKRVGGCGREFRKRVAWKKPKERERNDNRNMAEDSGFYL